VVDFPIAYVKRPIPVDNRGNPRQEDARRLKTFRAGGDLYVRNRASPSAPETNVTAEYTGELGDVKDIEVSYDGTKIVFAMRAPAIKGADADMQPTWNIWEYTLATSKLARVINPGNVDPAVLDVTADAGEDVAPHYLPDGRIVFSSTRQRQSRAILLDEGKPQFAALDEDRREPAFVLHVMNADGSNIHQISFNQSHDFNPTVLSNGKVLYSRWDNAGSRNAVSVYQMNPDGTALEVVYGLHSHSTGTANSTVQFYQARERYDGSLSAILKPFTGTYSGGDIVIIDKANFADYNLATWTSRNSATGAGQQSATTNAVKTNTDISPGGRFMSAYPLWDGTDRLLVSWNPCRLTIDTRIVPCTTDNLANEIATEAAPLYGIYVYDRSKNTQLPVVAPSEGILITDAVAVQARALATVIYDKEVGTDLNSDYADENVSVLHIRSVYDFDGTFNSLSTTATGITSVSDFADPAKATAAERPARFLRIEKAVSIPERVPSTAFGRSSGQLMREIIGYTMIEPDGSVMVKVPANTALAISVLDANGRRIGERHQNWLQVKAGETLTCGGCHSHATGGRHGHADQAPAINTGAPTSGLPFTNTDGTFVAQMGETMAQTRVRTLCPTSNAAAQCSVLSPSVNVSYSDVWTNTNVRAKDASFSYLYTNLTTTKPVAATCLTTWTSLCRIVINYETNIHPLWNLARGADTCTICHSPTDQANAAQIPAAQLDLTDGASDDEPKHFKSYRELLFSDNEQELVNGALQDRLVPSVDADGNPIMVPVPAQGPSMSTTGATASYFLDKFAAGGTHAGRLTSAELRLISEWLDIGAQYYNDPFAVPTN